MPFFALFLSETMDFPYHLLTFPYNAVETNAPAMILF